MQNLKVLSLENWMLFDHNKEWLSSDDFNETLAEYEPIFDIKPLGKPNIYLKNEEKSYKCWFELPDGRCFKFKKEQFLFRLNLLNAKELNYIQQNTILNFVKYAPTNLINKKIQDKAYYIYSEREIRNTGRESRKWLNNILKSN